MRHPIIRTIYLYLFALVGLVLISIGAVRFVDLGLKMFVFTKADEQFDYNKRPPVLSPAAYPEGKSITEEDIIPAIEKCKEKCDLTEAQKSQIANWLQDYKNWQELEAKIDYKTQQRQRDASTSLAFIIVGFPLYLYHWRIIRRETKNGGD